MSQDASPPLVLQFTSQHYCCACRTERSLLGEEEIGYILYSLVYWHLQLHYIPAQVTLIFSISYNNFVQNIFRKTVKNEEKYYHAVVSETISNLDGTFISAICWPFCCQLWLEKMCKSCWWSKWIVMKYELRNQYLMALNEIYFLVVDESPCSNNRFK